MKNALLISKILMFEIITYADALPENVISSRYLLMF